MSKTFIPKAEDIERKWYLVDANGKTLGRLASEISRILQGKHKAIFTPAVDTGDFVVVVNAEKIHLTGNKWNEKFYRRHSDYPGGLKEISYAELRDIKPEKMIELAVKRMLPKNKLAKRRLKRLKIYAGPEHPHMAQEPEELEI